MISIEYQCNKITTIIKQYAISGLLVNVSRIHAISINPHFGPNYSESVTEGYFFLPSSVKKTSTDVLQLVLERCAAASTQGQCDQMNTALQ